MIVNNIITKISLLLGCAFNEEANAKFVLSCLVFIVQILTSSVNLVLAGERAGKGIILLWISVRTEDYFGMATGLLCGRMNTSS